MIRSPGHVFALHQLGIGRQICILSVDGLNFYALLPDPERGRDLHFSYHESGERHMKDRRREGKKKKWVEMRMPESLNWPGVKPGSKISEQTRTIQARPADLRGAEPFFSYNILAGNFSKLPPVATRSSNLSTLDGESAGLSDNFTCVRGYLLEPGCEDAIPNEAGSGPRITHIHGLTTPWVAVDVFQWAPPQR
jgi:hypothetical protein